MRVAERISHNFNTQLISLLPNILRSTTQHLRKCQQKARSNQIFIPSSARNQLGNDRIHPRLMLHQHPQRLCRLRPNIGASTIAHTLHKRPLQLWEKRLDKRRYPLQHRRQRAQNRNLHSWRIRHGLSRNTNQRARKRNNEGLDRHLARAFHEVADGVRSLFPLVVAASCQASDDNGYRWRDALGEVEARDCAARRTCGIDGSTERNDEWLQFVFWDRLDEGIEGMPCGCVYRYLWVVQKGD